MRGPSADGGRSMMRRSFGPAGVIASVLVLGLLGCSGSSEPQAPPSTPISSSPPAPSTPAPSLTPTPSPTSTPTPATDPLTGGKLNKGEVFAVKIENTAAARPQVGLYRADIVVVEEVEAKITRMIGIFHTDVPGRVGPVRSARSTDAELLPMFGKPGLVYSGANSKVQRSIHQASLVPIERSDRDYSRPAPHNVMVNLAALAKQHAVGKAQPIGWTFAADDPGWAKAAKVATVKVKIGKDTTTFAYHDDRYRVSWNGRSNIDGDTHKPVLADNVVVLSVKNHHDTHSTSKISIVSETVGSGKVRIYRDGKQLTGTWKRDQVSAGMRLLDAQGHDISLKPGKTWLLLQG